MRSRPRCINICSAVAFGTVEQAARTRLILGPGGPYCAGDLRALCPSTLGPDVTMGCAEKKKAPPKQSQKPSRSQPTKIDPFENLTPRAGMPPGPVGHGRSGRPSGARLTAGRDCPCELPHTGHGPAPPLPHGLYRIWAMHIHVPGVFNVFNMHPWSGGGRRERRASP
jgi:hypothetical protein